MTPLMLLASEMPQWLTIGEVLVPLLVLVAGLGRVLQRLDTIATEHTAARAESKAQHEETRREIASLREDRVRAEVTSEAQGHRIERLESEVERLRDSVHKLLRSAQGAA